MTKRARARARAARVMTTTMRVVGNKEGKGGKGNEGGDKGGDSATAMATKRAMMTGTRVAGE